MSDTPMRNRSAHHQCHGTLFRTRLCKYGDDCQYGDRCYYAHSEEELRPRSFSHRDGSDPGIVSSGKYAANFGHSPRRGSRVIRVGDYECESRISDGEGIQRNLPLPDVTESAGIFGHVYQNVGNTPVRIITPYVSQANTEGLGSDFTDSESDSAKFSDCSSTESSASTSAQCYTPAPTAWYYCALIDYIRTVYQPAALEKLLRDAEPDCYRD